MDTPRVLVAEDDPSVRKAVERVLELEIDDHDPADPVRLGR